MKYEKPDGANPIDQGKVVGRGVDRIDGPLKTTGTAAYAYDRHDVVPNQAHGYIVAAGIPKGRIRFHRRRRREDLARRVGHRDGRHRRQARARATSTRRACSPVPTSSTTTRRSRSSWRKPSSRRVPRRISCVSTTRPRKASTTWQRSRTARRPPTRSGPPPKPKSEISTARSRRRTSRSTPSTPRPTSPTR